MTQFCRIAKKTYICNPKATLAQSVEQRIRNAQVVSSSLMSGSRKGSPQGLLFFIYRYCVMADYYYICQYWVVSVTIIAYETVL